MSSDSVPGTMPVGPGIVPGAVIKPGKGLKLEPAEGEVLHLSGACLRAPTSAARSFLILNQNGQDSVVAALKRDTMENVPLDIFIATRAGVEFKVQGEHEVHIFGYYEPAEDSDDSGEGGGPSDDEDDEDDDDYCMMPPQTAALTNAVDSDDDDGDDEDDVDVEDNKQTSPAPKVEEDDDDDDGDDDDDDDEEEKMQEMIRQLAEQKAKKDQKKKADKKPTEKAAEKVVEKPTDKTTEKPVVPAPAESKKRKATEPAVKTKPGKQQKTEDGAAAIQFEKSITDYLKKHGRSQVSQIAAVCPKPTGVATKYREFLVSRGTFNVEGNAVSLKQ